MQILEQRSLKHHATTFARSGPVSEPVSEPVSKQGSRGEVTAVDIADRPAHNVVPAVAEPGSPPFADRGDPSIGVRAILTAMAGASAAAHRYWSVGTGRASEATFAWAAASYLMKRRPVGGPSRTGARVVERAEFADFVEARSGQLLRSAYLLTHDWALAEDLLQTALTKAWFAWSRIDTNPEAYVRRTLINTYTSWWRRKWRGEVPHDSLPDSSGPDPTAASDDRSSLWTALGKLAPRQRAVLVLRFYEDLTEAQTANLLGCSVGTVKSTTHKSLLRLRADPGLLAFEPTSLQVGADEPVEILSERG